MKYLGLDIGGSKIAAVVMDEQGHEWRRFRVETRKQTRQQFIATLVELITAIGDELAQPLAIGIALPGVSPRRAARSAMPIFRSSTAAAYRMSLSSAWASRLCWRTMATVSLYQRPAMAQAPIIHWYLA